VNFGHSGMGLRQLLERGFRVRVAMLGQCPVALLNQALE